MIKRMVFIGLVVVLTALIALYLNLTHQELDASVSLALSLMIAMGIVSTCMIVCVWRQLPGDFDPGTLAEQNWR